MAKIIIAEDDPMIAEIYQKKLAEAGYETEIAGSGEQVIASLSKEKADLVLLDLVLPQMSGFEVIENIRRKNLSPGVKIIVFSNLSQSEDRDKAIKLGADGFIPKSDYTPAQAVSEITRLLHQFKEEKANSVRIKNGPGNGNGNGNGMKKILMMEDEPVFRDMFGEKLVADGFAVTYAENGAQGVKEAMADQFDLFIIDMVMPAMTGDEIVNRLQKEDNLKNIPIIILSASANDEERRQMENMGIHKFFVKTQTVPSELSQAVRELLK